MRFTKAFVPARGYWSSPFCKWQGKFSSLHPVHFAADVTRRALAARRIAADQLDAVVFGATVPSRHVFYGAPWLAALIGAEGVTGANVSQACATSAVAVAHAASRIECGGARSIAVVLADRCSNGPHLYYPNPMAPGGRGDAEDWVWDSFNHDPWAKNAMIETAETVAKEAGISREAQDALALERYEQYRQGVASGFHRGFMVAPYEVNPTGRKVVATVEHDEGVFATTEAGLAKLRPVLRDGSVTFGTQTFPADGNAGMVICDRERATELGGGESPVELLAFAEARVEKGKMAKAVVPAARKALDAAGVALRDVAVIKTHNPFAVNDLYFAQQLGIDTASFNQHGSSLVFGHPQGPTGARLMAEGIEQARARGGGLVLFAGCAAGDTAAAVVWRV
ncbi:MAG: thiolase family protein [Myxococcales bacterium FL481]|nr:MAG: thiolase family protein [Myxococcales bacterium FL481]